MPVVVPIEEALLRLFLAGFVAALLGWNREQAGKAAGLRTFTLVGLGSCLFTLLSLELIEAYKDSAAGGMDPLRLVSGLVGGIGFLGAGTIIQSRGSVHSVTTAACLWMTAAIGLASGLGQYALTGIAGALAIAVLVGLWLLEKRMGVNQRPDARAPGSPGGSGPGAG